MADDNQNQINPFEPPEEEYERYERELEEEAKNEASKTPINTEFSGNPHIVYGCELQEKYEKDAEIRAQKELEEAKKRANNPKIREEDLTDQEYELRFGFPRVPDEPDDSNLLSQEELDELFKDTVGLHVDIPVDTFDGLPSMDVLFECNKECEKRFAKERAEEINAENLKKEDARRREQHIAALDAESGKDDSDDIFYASDPEVSTSSSSSSYRHRTTAASSSSGSYQGSYSTKDEKKPFMSEARDISEYETAAEYKYARKMTAAARDLYRRMLDSPDIDDEDDDIFDRQVKAEKQRRYAESRGKDAFFIKNAKTRRKVKILTFLMSVLEIVGKSLFIMQRDNNEGYRGMSYESTTTTSSSTYGARAYGFG